MFDNKRKILKDSIIRLLQLSISDKEIVENLCSVGIDEATARELLLETRAELSSGRNFEEEKQAAKRPAGSEKKKPEAVLEGKGSPAGGGEGVQGQEDEESGQVGDEDFYREIEEQMSPSKKEKSGLKTDAAPLADSDVAQLWERGILATVDVKLSEMQHIRDELNSVLDAKISERVGIEAKKIETVLESQRTLFFSKIDSRLGEKATEVGKVIEAKARGMEDLHAKVQEELVKVQAEKRFNAELLNTLNEKLSGLDGVKSQMISQINGSIIQSESRFREIEKSADDMHTQTEEKVNRALQLEAKVTEGLIFEAKQKIEGLRLSKENELTARLQSKIKELDELTAKVDSKGISEKIARLSELEAQLVKRQKEIDKLVEMRFADYRIELTAFKREVSAINTSNLAELQKEYAANVDELFAKNLVEWDRKLKEKKKEIDGIKGQVDVEKFNATMESLDLFKQQFLNTVQRSIQDYNKAKKELAQSIIERDKAINDYLQKIDSKMQELSTFEKKFSADVAGLLGKVPEAARSRKK
ncbi:MAG TPA: hypothetical protein HA254_07770 [Candidatus Diapherotrites archaeon]|uniref:Uncharacterized protein n=1 Tax=Candidatus Iainarchaeum sp. TaxID=3101447 RepID=A0A7J4J061_9ARCH|nr:hypothetical protein [Candidatus Diapherotrites archaeon]